MYSPVVLHRFHIVNFARNIVYFIYLMNVKINLFRTLVRFVFLPTMDDILELKEFFVEGHDHDKSHVILHITEPSLNDVKKGYFFALAEIKGGSRDEIIDLEKIFDDLEKSYYNTQNSASKNALELSLEFINRRAHEVLQSSEADIDCFVGVLENFHLTFSTHGAPLGSLFYSKDGKLGHLSIVDTEESNERQFFSSLTEGDLHTGDSLLIATPQMSEFFSADRLEKLILTRSTDESVEHIEKVLKQLRSGYSYGGVLLHSAQKNEIQKTGKKPRELSHGSVASLHSLAQQEKETATTLSPPLFHDTREKMKNFLDERKEKMDVRNGKNDDDRKKIHSPDHPHAQSTESRERSKGDVILMIGRVLIAGLRGIILVGVSIARFFQRFFVNIFFLITNKRGKREHVIQDIRLSIQNKIHFWKHLPILSKILFGIAILSLAIFLGSIAYLRMNRVKVENNQKYTNLLTAIEEKKTAAEASLLYNDETRALTLIQEAQGYLDQIPKNSPEEQAKAAALQSELASTMSKLQKMTLVNPELLADLTTKNQNAKAEKMIHIDTNLLVSGRQDPTLYTVSVDSKEVTSQLHDTLSSLGTGAAPKEQDKVVFILGENGVAQYDKSTKALASADISFPIADGKIQSLGLYNRRLYTLDVKNNQVYKHSQTLTGYDKGTPWITETNFDIKDAVSLSIDGDIYLLLSNGQMLKFAGGKSVLFQLNGILPALTNPVEMWTSSDSKNIYILEPVSKRVIVTDKDGKFVKQYTSPTWKNLSSMVIDEKAKKIYILDENKIFSFGM